MRPERQRPIGPCALGGSPELGVTMYNFYTPAH